MQLIPSGAIGIRLLSNAPYTWAYADSLGLNLVGRRMLSVRRACGIRLSHKFNGKFGGVLANPATKWVLNV